MTNPLATLIHERLALLGLTLHELAIPLGYSNTNTGVRRLQSLLEGNRAHSNLLSQLPAALALSTAEVEEAAVLWRNCHKRSEPFPPI